ncbi:MAG: hypothetical protein HC780_11795 [Leptolyngbyaceae cyanobacterium CSU_1_3]|nr:hypothetical protein [Leptolyngbyaceae cyanobacterium CSU_1_3]
MATSETLSSLSTNLAALTTRPVASGLAVDPFTGNDVAVKPWLFGSSASDILGLTARAGTNPSVDGLPGFTTAIDTAGAGALRLTSAGQEQSSFVIYNQAIDSSLGLSITFEFFSYGGTGGDGISFFLIDGAQSPTAAGGNGGALGYAARGGTLAPSAGLVGGYLGIGFDEFGNFSSSTDNSPGGIGKTTDSIAVRGSQANQYRYLTGTGSLAGGLDVTGGAATRAAAKRTARIDLSPTGVLNVQIDLNADGDFLDTDETPTALQGFNVVTGNGDAAKANGALPANFKFGFSGSTGGSTNIHEVRGLSIGASGQLLSGLSGKSYTTFQPGVVIAPNLVVNNTVGSLTAATVLITNFKAGQDVLSIAGQPANATSGKIGNIDWRFDPTTGELGFDGNGTPAEYQAALRQVTYSNNSATPNLDTRNVRVRLDSLPGGPANEVPLQVALGVAPPRQPDILLRNVSSNQVVAWYLQGSTLVQGNSVVPFLDPAWAIVDSKDLNADNRADVLLRNNASGEMVIWYMGDNGAILPGSGYITTAGTPIAQVGDNTRSIKLQQGWSLVGLANVDADADFELVWQNRTNDEYAFWNINTTNNNFVSADYFRNTTGGILKTGSPNNWDIVGLGDFVGDSRSEVLLRAPQDQTAYWSFNVDAATSQVRLGAAAFLPETGNTTGTLRVRAIADFTGDGRADILWRRTDADITVLWTTVVNGSTLSVTPSTLAAAGSPVWTIGGADDFVGTGKTAPDGTADIVWRNRQTDQVVIWAIKNGQLSVAESDLVKLANGNEAKTGATTWEIEEANQFGVGTAIA